MTRPKHSPSYLLRFTSKGFRSLADNNGMENKPKEYRRVTCECGNGFVKVRNDPPGFRLCPTCDGDGSYLVDVEKLDRLLEVLFQNDGSDNSKGDV